MSIINLLVYASVFVAMLLLFRGGVYRLLCVLFPARSLKVTYVDKGGNKQVRRIWLEDEADVENIVSVLNEVKSSARLKRQRHG